MKGTLRLLLLALIIPSIGLGAPPQTSNVPTDTEVDDQAQRQPSMPSLTELPADFWSDIKGIAALPSRLDAPEWRRVAIGASAIGALAVWDENIRDYAQDHRDDFYDDFKDLGDWRYAAGFFLATHLAGRLTRHYGLAETGVAGAEALLLTAVPVLLMQGVTGRARPEDGGSYNWFSFDDGHGASGHTATAFATVTVLDRRLCQVRDDMTPAQKWTRYAGKAALYGAASGTALERINDDKHFASDVALGGTIAFLCSNYVMNRRDSDVRIVAEGDALMICIVRNF